MIRSHALILHSKERKELEDLNLEFREQELNNFTPRHSSKTRQNTSICNKGKRKAWSFMEFPWVSKPNNSFTVDLRTWPFYVRTWPFYQQTTVIRSKQVSWWKAPRLFHCTRKQCTPQQHQECLWQPRWSRWFLVGCIMSFDMLLELWYCRYITGNRLIRNVTLPPVYVPPRMCLCVEPVNILQQSISICSNVCFCRCPKHKLCWQKEWGFMLISLVVSVCNPPSVEKTSHWQR